MARIRTIKPEFFTSLTIADLPLRSRLTFIGLWTHVDDEGRCIADPRLIKAAIWPLDDVGIDDVVIDLGNLTESSLIAQYEVGSRRYLVVTGWAEHQRINRPSRSKFPPPPWITSDNDSDASTSENSDSSTSHSQFSESSSKAHDGKGKEQGTGNRERNREGKGAQSAPPRAKRATRLPDDFVVTDAMKAWARQNTPNVGALETEKFRDYWRSKSGQSATKTDWIATWRNWMRRAEEQRQPRGRQPALAGSAGAINTHELDYGGNL